MVNIYNFKQSGNADSLPRALQGKSEGTPLHSKILGHCKLLPRPTLEPSPTSKETDTLFRVIDQGRRNPAVDPVDSTAEKPEECTAFSADSNERQNKKRLDTRVEWDTFLTVGSLAPVAWCIAPSSPICPAVSDVTNDTGASKRVSRK